MKKHVLLFLIILGLSTTAWGGFACVTPPACAVCCEPATINVRACIPYNCVVVDDPDVCVRGNMVVVDIYLSCQDCECGGCTMVDEEVSVALCPGTYSVIARIHVECSSDCWPSRPRVGAMGSAFFKVSCGDPCGSPYWPPSWPCCPWPCTMQ